MNRKVTLLPILGGLVVIMFLSACGPSQTDLDATATHVAADIFATQTADEPTVTPTYTITPIPTNTPTATPDPNLVTSGSAGCNQEMLERFLRTKAPEELKDSFFYDDSISAASIREEFSLDVELFSDAYTYLMIAILAEYGGSMEDDYVWKIEQKDKDEIEPIYQKVLHTDEPCLVYLEWVVDGEIVGAVSSFFIQIEKEIIIPGDDSTLFIYKNWMSMEEEEALEDGVPLRPLPTNTSGGIPFPTNTPTATQTPQPDPNMTLEVKGMYLQEFISNDWSGSPGAREGDMALDRSGRIWVAGGGLGLTGLHVFDGTQWTNYNGEYWDLAVGMHGEIWAAPLYQSGVDFFDGQQMITGQDLGLGGQKILQVEVDSNGRIWVVADDFGSSQVAEIVIRENKATVLFSHPEFTITDGQIYSLDADNQGRLWASVWTYTSSDIEIESDGLNVFDGGAWQLVTDQDVDLQNVVRTTYDDQGTVWVATQCGSVMTYDGTTWTTVVEGDTEPDCDFVDEVWGITLDPQGRLWAWSSYRIRLLKDGSWVVFTHENSDLPEYGIFGLAVDNEDQVWIGTSEGVVMATLQ
jgi:hypothetical protein